MNPKRYTGAVYVGVVGSDIEYGVCRDSIDRIILRPGDVGPNFIRATKGFEARQMHINKFIDSNCSFILLLDQDQTFPPDILERLRDHQLPYVSGFYLRRQTSPIFSVWYKPQRSPDDWPMEPWFDIPERGKLHELGASGWGCILVHRDVVMGVRELLHGEQEVIEDDMDVWPYDLEAVLRGDEKLRVLRGRKDNVGSDIRFPFYARAAGYKLMGDPDAICGHVLDFVIERSAIEGQDAIQNENQRIAHAQILPMRREHRMNIEALR